MSATKEQIEAAAKAFYAECGGGLHNLGIKLQDGWRLYVEPARIALNAALSLSPPEIDVCSLTDGELILCLEELRRRDALSLSPPADRETA